MADDIDIKEHDVLEDPRTRGMLSDLDKVKTEPTEYDDEDAIKQEQDEDEYHNYYQEEEADMEADNKRTEPISPECPQFNNKIILGTKPKLASCQPHSNQSSDDDKVFNSRERLYSSKCRDCEIFFPTRNALDAHNTVAHSFPVARSHRNIAIKSTAKAHTANVAKKSTTGFRVTPSAKKSSDLAKYNNHCKLTFIDNTALIKHLPAKVQECNVCNDVFDTARELDEHKKVHSDLDATETLSCPVCFCFFRGSKMYYKHCKVYHGCILEPRRDLEFDGLCPFCPYVTTSVRSLQEHHHAKHIDQLTIKVETEVKATKMNETRFFFCKLCTCYYTLITRFRWHLRISHSTSLTKPYDRELFNPKCKFCKSTFKNTMDYNTHIRTDHSDAYKKIGIQNKSTAIKHTSRAKTKFRCRICNEIVIGKPAAIAHREKHRESKKLRIKTKSLMIEKPPMVRSETVPLVPQGIIFKCDKCPVHFLISQTAESHSDRGCTIVSQWKCYICKREFNTKDQAVHLMQHQAIEKLKVFTVRPKLFRTVLCHCFKCKVYYDEYSFWRKHCYGTCVNNLSVHCEICKRNIYGGCYRNHLEMHKEINMNDFIIINYELQNNDSLKRKLSENDSTYVTPKKAKNSFNHYFYCGSCKSYFIDSTNIQTHLDESCHDVKKSTCNFCGLLLPTPLMYRHTSKHEDPKFEPIKNGTFICIQNMKKINPPIPEFFRCNDCSVNYLSSGTLHQCSDKQVKCYLCNKKYNEYAFKLHNKYHREIDSSGSCESSNLSDDILLKKYLSIQPIWNILYQCETCDVVTDSYDQVVEHCQMHFNDMAKCDVFRCDDCQLAFHSSCYVRHCQLHAESSPMNRDSFKIIGYDYTQLPNLDVWLTENRPLTAKQMSQITSRSIYKFSRCIKFDVIQKSDPECTLYKCGKCLNCVDPRDVVQHERQRVCFNKTSSKCTHCNLNFDSEEVRIQHENQHGTVTEFGLIIFNSEKDRLFNTKIQANTPDRGDDSAAVFQLKSLVRSEKNKNVITLFKCEKCKVCLTHKNTARKHICSGLLAQCYICKNKISKFRLQTHLDLHKSNPKFNYMLFNPRTGAGLESYARNVKLYKCSCGLHFMTESSIQKHYQECGDERISRDKCSKCNLLFPTNVLVNHLCNHHTDECKINVIYSPNLSDAKDKNIYVYRCDKCNLHYNTPKGLEYHLHSNHVLKYDTLKSCDICNIDFPQKSASIHMKLHTQKTFNVNDIHFITKYTQNTPYVAKSIQKISKTDPVKEKKNLCTIYKCSTCPAHFMSYKTYRKHCIKQQHCKKEDLTKCKGCGIRFLFVDRHYTLHHEQMGLTLDHIKVVEQKYEKGKRTYYKTIKTEYVSSISGSSSNEYTGDEDFNPKIANVKKTMKRKSQTSEETLKGHDCETNETTINDTDGETNETMTDDTDGETNQTTMDETNKTTTDDTDGETNETTTDETYEISTDDTDGETNKTKTNETKTTVILHKCTTCNCHFVNRKSVITHTVRERHLTENEGVHCEYCGLLFTKVTLAIHDNLHHKNGKLKHIDYSIMKYSGKFPDDTETSGRESSTGMKLFKCEFCNLHFMSHRSMRHHLLAKNHQLSDGVECEYCGLMFYRVAIDQHKLLHHKSGENLDPSHFHINVGLIYVVPFYGEQACLYKCSVCLCHFIEKDYFKTHMEVGNHIPENERETCKECGLLFSKGVINNHLYNHHQRFDLNLENFKIIEENKTEEVKDDSSDEKHDVPQSSKAENSLNASNCGITIDTKTNETKTTETKTKIILHKCDICKCHYLNRKSIIDHLIWNCPLSWNRELAKHGNSHCEYCGLLFEYDSLGTHINVHHKYGKLKHIDCRIMEYRVQFPDDTEPQVRKSYKGMELFKCEFCNLHFVPDSRSMRRHLRLKNHQFSDGYGYECEYCGLMFDWIFEHQSLHHKYGDNNDPSHFNINVGFIYEVDFDGEQASLYKCSVCLCHFMHKNYFKMHMEVGNHIPENERETCKECGLLFSKGVINNHLYNHHQRFDLNLENFKIIEENKTEEVKDDSCDEKHDVPQSSKAGYSFNAGNCGITADTNTNETKTNETKTKVILHKCTTCNCHFVNRYSVISHTVRGRHLTENEGFHCEYCGLLFTKVTLATHVNLHHKNGKLKHIDCSIMKYSGKFSDDTKTQGRESSKGMELFKCEFCNLHFVSKRSMRNHLRAKNHQLSNGVECEYCGLMFYKGAIDQHKVLHHKSGDNLDPSHFHINVGLIHEVPFDGEQACLYKCSVCLCHFIEKDYFKTHMEVGNHIPENERETCKECGLLFSKGIINNHFYNHHQCFDLNLENFKIIEENKTEEPKDDSCDEKHDVPQSSKADNSLHASNCGITADTNKTAKKYKLKLYKCGECNVYFMTQSACYKHASEHVPIDPMEYIECKICSLQFNYTTLHIHMKNDHFKQNFDLEDLLVEEYKPAASGVPQIDIYCAVDRIQSRLVCTMTDDAQEPSRSKEVAESSHSSVRETNPQNEDITVEDASKELEIVDDPKNYQTEIIDVNANDDAGNDIVQDGTHLSCKFCKQTFKSRSSLGLHESLEHAMKKCPICKCSFNESILNEIHLVMENNKFKCCLCSTELNIEVLETHSCSDGSKSDSMDTVPSLVSLVLNSYFK